MSDLLYFALELQLKYTRNELKNTGEYTAFSKAASEIQLINLNGLTRLGLLSFFINCYNLMVNPACCPHVSSWKF